VLVAKRKKGKEMLDKCTNRVSQNVDRSAGKLHHSSRTESSAPASAMDENDDLSSIQSAVEHAVELFVQLSYFPVGSAVAGIDAGRFIKSIARRPRARRVFLGGAGQRLSSVLPGGTVVPIIARSGRSGGFACPQSDRDAALWKSTIGSKLGRLEPVERRKLQNAAKLHVASKALEHLIANTDAVLGSSVARKGLTLIDVRMMQDATDEILSVFGRPIQREWRGTPAERARREQGYRRRIKDRCSNKRRSIVNEQVYANAWSMFAILCGRDRDYCFGTTTPA
jgi:hypothetical protein